MTLISELYDCVSYLYNINHLKNIASVFKNGILSKNELKKMKMISVDLSNSNVQEIRETKKIPNHGFLHDYANLYFNPRNPMMYYLINHYSLDELCIVCVSKEVLNLKGTVVSDRNAAAELAAFESAEKGKKYINFQKVFARYWTDDNHLVQTENKQIQCAEVLVLDKVPSEYILGVFVCTHTAKRKIEELRLGIKVLIREELFFQ